MVGGAKRGKVMMIRKMTAADIDQVLAIEQLSFTVPWSRESFVFEMTQNDSAIYFVGEVADEIVCYCGAWFVLDQATITNVAVLPSYRGQKLGDAIFHHMVAYAKEAGIHQLSLEVRVSNIAAQSLYKNYGFAIGGTRRGYYSDNLEDAYVMWVEL